MSPVAVPVRHPGATLRAIAWVACLSLLACLSVPACAQNCSQPFITLQTQSDVDDFQNDFGPCNAVGDLTIQDDNNGSDNIVSLIPLTGLTSGQALRVSGNASLSSLSGLSGFGNVAFLTVEDNPQLGALTGLTNLTQVSDILRIRNNASLTSLSGLAKLAFARDARIEGNTLLSDLSGFAPLLSSIDRLVIRDNPQLGSVAGLPSGIVVLEELVIDNNDMLADLDGLPAFTQLGEVDLRDNNLLSDLTGLAASGFDEEPPFVTNLLVRDNAVLPNLVGIPAVQRLGDITITGNLGLTSLDGLETLQESWGVVTISGNPLLSDCTVLQVMLDDVDDGEIGPGVLNEDPPPGPDDPPDTEGLENIDIGNNAGGCNTIAEILGGRPQFIYGSSFEAGEIGGG